MSIGPKYKKFADSYLLTGNASESARVAGWAAPSAGVTGHKLLKRPDVQAYLRKQTEKLSSQEDSLQQRVISELEALAFANITDFISIDADGRPQVDFSTATPEQLRAITAVKSKSSKKYNGKGEHIATDQESAFTMADKYRGLELLGRHLGLFKTEEQRVVVDVADRLLNARRRLATDGERGDVEIA